jgi:hypothetical protein
MLITSVVRKFKVLFRVIPARKWSKEALVRKLDLLNLPRVEGEMEVDLMIQKSLTGTFKTAHRGQIVPPTVGIPPCFMEKICVKQAYQQRSSGAISRYRGADEFEKIVKEVICLDWATILLDLTYGFIEEAVTKYGDPPEKIPQLCFVRTMLAEAPQEQKHFLIEEWVESVGGFTKYINNGHPVSCVQANAPREAHQIAEFLCFAQHVQYNHMDGLAFTSDYQG